MSEEEKELKAPTEVMKDFEKMIRENKLKVIYKVDFPIYKVLPDEVDFALKMMSKHGMQISFNLKEEK